MIVFAMLVYVLALVTSNLLVHRFGPSITPYLAFTLVGMDLSIRDWLNVTLPRWGMAILIPSAGLLAYALDPATRLIAIASTTAFVVSEWAEWGTFSLVKGTWFSRAVRANIVAAAVDSLLFPTLAFGHVLPWIVAGQFVAKILGSTLWAYFLQYVPIRRRS